MLSAAEAVRVVVPVSAAPAAGAVRLTVGAVGSVVAVGGAVGSVAVYVTVSVAVAVLPAASGAVTVRMLLPGWSAMPAVDQVAQALVVVAGPEPPRLFDQATWVTPILSPAAPPRASGLVAVV